MRRIRHHDDDGVRALRDLHGRLAGNAARGNQLRRNGRDVMQENAMARGQEMAGHRPSHGAKSDEADVDHVWVSSRFGRSRIHWLGAPLPLAGRSARPCDAKHRPERRVGALSALGLHRISTNLFAQTPHPNPPPQEEEAVHRDHGYISRFRTSAQRATKAPLASWCAACIRNRSSRDNRSRRDGGTGKDS